MRRLLIITYLFIYVAGSAQTYNYRQGERFIRKAERKIEEGKYDKAETLLKKASQTQWFCGQGRLWAAYEIYILQAKIYKRRKEYDKAIAVLDSIEGCEVGLDCTQRETVRIEILIDKFGQDKVREAFTMATMKITEDDFSCNYLVNLPSLSYSFSFPIRCEYRHVDGKEIRIEPDMEQVLKQQPFYALLE